MIALTIFSIGILAVASMACTGMRGITIALRTTYQSLAAGAYIEDILSRPYGDALLVDTDNGYAPCSPDHGPFEVDTTPATIEWEVDDDFPAPGTKRISLTVRHNGRGRMRTITYEYVKAKDFRCR